MNDFVQFEYYDSTNDQDTLKLTNFNMLDHLKRQRAFSENAFGPNFRYKGIIEHIKKELIEIENDPHDLLEWIDVALLAFDGAWRSGHSPEQILSALINKLAKNEKRQWPDWRTISEDKAIEHIEYALVRFTHDLEDGWYVIQWPDKSYSEFNHWKDAKKEIVNRGLQAKWDGPESMNHYCPMELRK